ncbi:MAG: hypothetical protein ACRD2G_09625 [Terriglobia bacterium]
MLSDMLSHWDQYGEEYELFQQDVHILIKGTLDAALKYLDSNGSQNLTSIERMMENAQGDYHEHLIDEHMDVQGQNASQETFLRNMALVALTSRLTHSLRKMARVAETFSPRKKRYGNSRMSEFARLWSEYWERFQIKANAAQIAFVDALREVRNQIVHEGGEANTLKPISELDPYGDAAGILDLSFSKKYPQYVCGEGMGAEVSVSEALLEENIEAAINLVGWLAAELRRNELASIQNTSGVQ